MNTPSSRKPDPVPPGVNGGAFFANAYRQSGEARNGVPSRKVNPMGAKPRIRSYPYGWICLDLFRLTWIGAGITPKSAYEQWAGLNGGPK